MKKKFNLALIPQTKADAVIHLASQFSSLADQYILGKNSNPHVTLYQFEFEENEIADLWTRVSAGWKEKPIMLEFNHINCSSFDDIHYWVALLPDQNAILNKMHSAIADLLGLPVKKTFQPHMTLINSKNKNYKEAVGKLSPCYHPIIDTFVLCIGSSDHVGQLTEILYRYKLIKICDSE